ncbi:IS1 family transposase [Rosenbergiella nectarea]
MIPIRAKSPPRWLFYADDSIRKIVVAHVFGEMGINTTGGRNNK